MAGVFTIYNCGTNYHKDSGDVVANLSADTSSASVINDGPGSGQFMPNVLGGRPDPTDWSPVVSWFGIVGGLFFGTGVEKNVERAIEAIKGLPSLPSTLNMCGWSRGAVTCLKIANDLQKDPRLSSIRVNIFAIDPVPGTSFVGNDHMWKDIGLSGNIDRYMAIIAQHERRIEMTPVVPSTTDKRAWVDLMPGVHSSMVQETAGAPGPATLVRHLATKFLTEAGTKFFSPRLLDNYRILSIYDAIKRNWNAFKQLGEDEAGFIRRKMGNTLRPVKDDREGPNRTLLPRLAGFFVNNHHREVFAMTYPNVLVEINGVASDAFSPRRSNAWLPDMARMGQFNPETQATIRSKFMSLQNDCKVR